MSRKRDLPNAKKSEGTICYGSEILTNIITFAVDEADGVAIYPSKKPISYVFDKDGLIIDVDVKINYNLSVSEIAYKIQDSIKHNVEAMTEYKINTVNVNVKDVFFDDTSEKDKL